MSMKKLADKVTAELSERMEGYTDSRQPSDDEVSMAALVCRIQELEESISAFKHSPITENKHRMFELI